eukprot:364743-Chlamydomonas_euryale.AAC.114
MEHGHTVLWAQMAGMAAAASAAAGASSALAAGASSALAAGASSALAAGREGEAPGPDVVLDAARRAAWRTSAQTIRLSAAAPTNCRPILASNGRTSGRAPAPAAPPSGQAGGIGQPVAGLAGTMTATAGAAAADAFAANCCVVAGRWRLPRGGGGSITVGHNGRRHVPMVWDRPAGRGRRSCVPPFMGGLLAYQGPLPPPPLLEWCVGEGERPGWVEGDGSFGLAGREG